MSATKKKDQPNQRPVKLSPADIVDRLFPGHAAEVLSGFPEASIDLVVTSPPYWTAVEYDQGKNPWTSYETYLTDMQSVWHIALECCGPTESSVSTLRSCRSQRQ